MRTAVRRACIALIATAAAFGAGFAAATDTTAAPVIARPAAPLQQGTPTCTWRALAPNEVVLQHTLVPWPDKGAVLFGGADPDDETVTDGVHGFDLTAGGTGTWTKLTTSGGGPGKRTEHTAILRQQPGSPPQMVAYGGTDRLSGGSGGTFTWRSPLLGSGAAVESLEGTYAPAKVQSSAFRLTLDGGTPAWSQISGGSADPRTDHSAVYNPDDDSMVVFGGRDDESGDSATDDLYRLTLGDAPKWEERRITGGPSKRYAHSAVYDSVAKRMIVFGGTQDWESGLNDVYALDLSSGWATAKWARITPSGRAPTRRYDHGAVFLPDLNWMLVYGGSSNGKTELDDLYALNLSSATPAWQAITPTGSTRPKSWWMFAATYLPAQNLVVFQGGAQDGTTKQLTWGLQCTGGAVTPSPTNTDTAPTETATPSATPTATASPTPQCTPPPCPCGRLVGSCPNVTCEGTCTPLPPTATHTPTATATDEATPTATATPKPPAIYMPRLFNTDDMVVIEVMR